jgi:hypothetical protein
VFILTIPAMQETNRKMVVQAGLGIK